MSVTEQIQQIAQDARAAAQVLGSLSAAIKNDLLQKMADSLIANTEQLATENEKDLFAAREAGLAPAMIDRLVLDTTRIRGPGIRVLRTWSTTTTVSRRARSRRLWVFRSRRWMRGCGLSFRIARR